MQSPTVMGLTCVMGMTMIAMDVSMKTFYPVVFSVV